MHRWLRPPGMGGWLRLAAVPLVLLASGCVWMSLQSRGAPDAEIRTLEARFQAADLMVSEAHGHEGHDGGYFPPEVWVRVPMTGWVHGFDYEMLNGNGEAVPPEVLHHFKVLDPDRRELFSPIMLHLAGGGSETKPVSLPTSVGVPVQEGDSLLFTAMLHNPTTEMLEGVRLTISVQYTPVGTWRPPLEVVPFFTHVTPATVGASYDLPAGSSAQSIDVQPAVSGWILGLGGHLHQYGVLLRLEDLSDGRVLWEKRPTVSADGSVLEISSDRFITSRGPRLSSDRVYRVTAFYENPTGAVIPGGGMGTIGGAFVPEEPWPEVDRRQEDYASYLERELNMGKMAPGSH